MLARLTITVLLLGVTAPEASAARQLGASYARARREGRARGASGPLRSRAASRSRALAASRRVSSRGVSRGGTRLTFPRGAPSITGRVTFDGATTGTFVVDTGATSVALSSDFARRVGLDLRGAQRGTV
ncbi:MAG TPA: aspartyl protease family protein, partial [Kofleriaceae bacterium]|nr:aspartyl protease family protein [Kofleriaceae bacterium]